MTLDTARRRNDTLRLRILSALVLLPAALAAVWFGPPWVTLIVALAGLAMGWEWGRLSSVHRLGPREAIVAGAVVLAVGAAAAGRFPLALILAAVGASAASFAQRDERGWTAMGTLWIALGCIAFIWLTAPPRGDRATIFLLLGVVWATDIFAYFVGKAIGGPPLAPRLSPNKTWSGFAGGLVGGGAVGLGAALWTGAWPAHTVAVSFALSLCSQGGDLAESLAKRHFAVKDMSGLIPGHGGVLDRLDGLLAATLALALLMFVTDFHI